LLLLDSFTVVLGDRLTVDWRTKRPVIALLPRLPLVPLANLLTSSP